MLEPALFHGSLRSFAPARQPDSLQLPLRGLSQNVSEPRVHLGPHTWVGFQPLSRQEANLFFRMVSYRYQRGSTLITTNKSVKEWPEVLAGDEVMTAALLDRLLHRCHVLNIKGRSYRLRELEAATK